MGNRLTQIATRTGDDGTTGLGDNTRVSKNSGRPHAMGDVDELNSHIGLLLCENLPADVRIEFIDIAHGMRAAAVLGHTAVVAEASRAIVSGPGGDLCQTVAHGKSLLAEKN